MIKHAIYHISQVPYAYAEDENTLKVRLRCAKDDIREAEVIFKDRYDWENRGTPLKMIKISETDLFSYFEASLKVPRNRYRYYFRITDRNNEVIYYDELGLRQSDTEKYLERRSFQFPYIGKADIYEGKKILQDAIVYQIFPDRFKNADKNNDPEGTEEWGSEPLTRNMFGGDLKGITEEIPYLKELGINLIYLTPIFRSTSNHKYNTEDYFSIDPHFGTLEDARELTRKCHEAGIKVFFDAVFNHTGSDFFAFKDVLKNQEKSEYASWYHLDEFPVSTERINYYTFADNIRHMPKLRTENQKVREYFFEVGRYWIRECGIDGWRLDVCDEVDHEFWRGFKKAIEEENPESSLVGEIMHESSSFLMGKELDSIMNYPFKNAVTEFIAKRTMSTQEFTDALSYTRMHYMDKITRQLWNLIDSHDTARFLTESEGDIRRLKLAMALQFTYIGVPYIYYGDEIGLDGGHDPGCRKCMVWDKDKRNNELLEYTKKLTHFRKENEILKLGSAFERVGENKAFIVERRYKDRFLLCIFNNSDNEISEKLPSGIFRDITPTEDIKTGTVKIKDTAVIPALSYLVLERTE